MSDEVINPHEVLAEGKRPRGRPKGKAKANRRLKAIAMIEKDKEEALKLSDKYPIRIHYTR